MSHRLVYQPRRHTGEFTGRSPFQLGRRLGELGVL